MAAVKGRRVLVTGAGGFIGRALVERLAEEGAVVHALGRRGPIDLAAARPVAVPLEELTAGYWARHEIGAFDTVFHLGAFTPKTRRDADDIDANFVSNLIGTRCLLQSLVAPPRRFVFASTIDVYAPMQPDATLTESSALEASSVYASSKLCGERMVLAWGAQAGAETAVLRYGHVYGPGEAAYQKLIPHTIRILLRGENPVVVGDGSAERDFVYVSDVVEATMRCAWYGEVPAGPVNVVSGTSHRIVDVVQHLIEATGSTAVIERRQSRGPERSFRFDCRRMRANFGEWPLTSLTQGLRNEVDYVRGGG